MSHGNEDFTGNFDKRLTIRLDEKRFNELVTISRNEGFNASMIVRHLVYRYLEEKRRFSAAPRFSHV